MPQTGNNVCNYWGARFVADLVYIVHSISAINNEHSALIHVGIVFK